MAQQVNLCLPVLRQQKSRFAAQTLVLSLLAILAVGGLLSVVWVYNMHDATVALKANLDAQTKEMEALRAAIEQYDKSSAPAEQALQQEIKARREVLQQRDSVLAALSQGLFEPGHGHAARLQLVAQSIPPVVWVTQIRADGQFLEISGFTLEPAALNDWVQQLAASPLLRGQALSTIKVESAKPGMSMLPVAGTNQQKAQAAVPPAAIVQDMALPQLWSFTLQSIATPKPASMSGSGAKP
jgi:Tfp pilus assembly protein PilN